MSRCYAFDLMISVAAVGFAVLVSPAIADEALYRKCRYDRTTAITTNIINQCRADMAKIITNTGKTTDALLSEEQTCEATARTHAEGIAAKECEGLQRTPPLNR